jgi:hypothetical protein
MMRRSTLAAAAALATTLLGAGSVSAQTVFVQSDDDVPVYGYYYTAPAAPEPAYREYRNVPGDSSTVRTYVAPRNCGTYRYLRNGVCVDARYWPPGTVD